MKYFSKLLIVLLCILPDVVMAQEANPFIQFDKVEETYELYMSHGKPRATVTKKYLFTKSNLTPTAHMNIYFDSNMTYEFKCRGDVASWGEEKMVHSGSILHNDLKVRSFDIMVYHRSLPKSYRKFYVKQEYLDATYLTTVFLNDDYRSKKKVVKIIIPKNMPFADVHEFLYGDKHVDFNMVEKRGKRTYTYTMTNMPALYEDKNAPSAFLYRPHLVLDCAFKDVNDLYKWNMSMADVDCSIDGLESLMSSIVKGCKTDEEKIAAIYDYVQTNIRYIAFEAGQEGYRPDRPQEIVRKKYGDCKGMAILLRTLLKAGGFDARYGIVGTVERPYKMTEVSSICVANHAICVLYHKGRTYFLDATYKNLPYTSVPGHISGKQVLVENGEKCVIETVPVLTAEASVDSVKYDLSLKSVGGQYVLEGAAKRMSIGDCKEMMNVYLDKTSTDNKESMMREMLDCLRSQSEWSDVHDTENKASFHTVEGRLTNRYNVTSAGNDVYVDLAMGMTYQSSLIDTTLRRADYDLDSPCRIVRQASVTLPAGYEVKSLPENFSVNNAYGSMSVTFGKTKNGVEMKKVLQLNEGIIKRADIDRWNADLRDFTAKSCEMIVLKKNGVAAQAQKPTSTKSNKSKKGKK